MALAHAGSHPRGSPRLRILIRLCELSQAGTAPTYREIQRSLGMSAGAVSYHMARLEHEGSIVRSGRARDLELSSAALAELVAGGWLIPARRITSFGLSEAAIELLELAGDSGGQAVDYDPLEHDHSPATIAELRVPVRHPDRGEGGGL